VALKRSLESLICFVCSAELQQKHEQEKTEATETFQAAENILKVNKQTNKQTDVMTFHQGNLLYAPPSGLLRYCIVSPPNTTIIRDAF